MESLLRPLKRCGLHWFSIYQDLDPKRQNDNAYRNAELNSPHVASMRNLLNTNVVAIANDREADWALRWRLKRNVKNIEYKLAVRANGSKFSMWFIVWLALAAYLLFGMEIVGFLLPEWAAVARNLPTDIRTAPIYLALFMFWAITSELLFRILEDRLVTVLISTTAYLLVIKIPGWRPLYEEEWFIWTVVALTGVLVTVISSLRAARNTVEAYFIRKKTRNPAFIQRVTQLCAQLQEPTDQMLDLMDDHEEVESTREMIFGTSKLSSNLQMQNSFMKKDIGDVLKALECCLPRKENIAAKARRRHPMVWLFGEGDQTYQPAPKLFMAALTLVIMALAVVPFFKFPFVIGTAVVWGLRCFLRILFPALSPYQSVRDVLKIFGSFVSSGLLDAPYSIALLVTNFKIFDHTAALIGLTGMETILVLTVSDAVGPLALFYAEKWGWIDKPGRRRRCGGNQQGSIPLTGLVQSG